ncbi:glutaredoxin family protein [Planomicrobium okeanokoites]
MMLTLYTRPNCPLCEEAKLMLKLVQEDFPLEFKEVNIEEDDRLHEKYMLMIPVLEQDGEVLIYGNIGYAEILEALDY